MNEGTTQVGSIVGKLRLDDSQWNRTLDAAEARARELGTADPTIKVDAKVDEALAKLALVEKRVNQLERANARLGSGLDRVNGSQQRHLRHWQVIALLILALIPLLGPLLSWTIAVAGGFAAMGAAGVLALYGIKRAMDAGSASGQQYQRGLKALKGDLDALADTGAVSMLQWFRRAVDEVDRAMPSLNGQVRYFSSALGSTGNHFLSGVLTSLRVLNPLLVLGAIYVNQLAAGFESWTRNGGLQEFTTYAIGQIPIVSAVLGELLRLVVNLIQATAPLGTAALEALTNIAAGLNGIPLDVLTALITLAVGAVVGFKLWGIIAPVIGSVASAMGALGVASAAVAGPLGWVSAGLGALVAIASVATSVTRANTNATNAYAEALRAAGGAVDEQVQATAAKNLQDAGAFEIAKRLGISTETVTQAVLGNAEALGVLEDAQRKANARLAEVYGGAERLALLREAEITDGGKLVEIVNQQSEALSAAKDVYGDMSGAVEGTTDRLADLRGEAQEATDRVTGLADVIRDFGTATLDTRAAQRDFEAAVDAVTEKVAQQKEAYRQAHGSVDDWTASLDIGTAAGRENQAALDAIATSAMRSSAAIYEQTGSQQQAAAAIQSGRDQLVAQLALFGITGREAEAYADKLHLIPSDVETALVLLGVSKAEQQLEAFVKKFEGKKITMRMFLDTSGGNRAAAAAAARYTGMALQYGSANGGSIGLSDGGTAFGPGTSRSDSIPVWLSKGEEVIRESSASQAGVRPFLKDLNDNPGRALGRVADAGKATAGATMNVTQHVRALDPVAAAREAVAMLTHTQKALAT